MKDLLIRQNENVEKFCLAVLLVLDNSKVPEEMKHDIRLAIAKIVKDISFINKLKQEDRDIMSFIKDITDNVDSIISIMSFMMKSGYVIEERFQILKTASQIIKDKLSVFLAQDTMHVHLSLMVDDLKKEEAALAQPTERKNEDKGGVNKFVKKISNFSRIKSPVMLENDRKTEILKILSSVPISIKDISSKISDCSEKTIQRELNALVDMKKVSKYGEKRWSKYALYSH